jgi:hypothetical protein
MIKFKVVLLAVAIAVVFVFFIGFGISTFYKAPLYENFCPQRDFRDIRTQETCESNDGKWFPNEYERKIAAEVIERPLPKSVPAQETSTNMYVCTRLDERAGNITFECKTIQQLVDSGYCDLDFYCREEFEDVRQGYERNVFIIAVGLGIIALIVGIALKLPNVSSGIMGGGILTILYGIIRYWSDLPDYGRFIILGIALVILIWLGYKKINR